MTLSQVWFSPVNRLTKPTHGYSRCSMPQLLELIALHMFNRSWEQDLTKRMASNNKKNNRMESKTMKQRRLHNVKLNRKSNKDRLRWRKMPDEKRPRRRNVDKSRLKRRKEEGSSKRSMKTNSKNSKCNSSKRWSRI